VIVVAREVAPVLDEALLLRSREAASRKEAMCVAAFDGTAAILAVCVFSTRQLFFEWEIAEYKTWARRCFSRASVFACASVLA
jgi:hypothetical protein